MIALGIDTGGTYTDAALVDHDTGRVLCAAKALTTRRDLSIGIGQAVDAVLQRPEAASAGPIGMVAVSTTLATNAIVEGQGSRVCLVLIGYDPDLIHQYGFEHELVTDDVVYIDGGHDIHGDAVADLDEDGLRQAVLARKDQVDAFGVSSYFGVRNPDHEIRARALIEELTGLPVTCGHELTTRLNSVRRATTVALNARLVPLLRELIDTLRHSLAERQIVAPLMVVKGDGSLVRAEWAMQRPIETILSGPAASAVGAWHLARQTSPDLAGEDPAGNLPAVWVVDVGGTTTDIAGLREGRPRLNIEGAQVGSWRTMVEAVDVYTVGLGGDSQVKVTSDRRLTIGPQRVVPISLLASEHPEVVEDLRNQAMVPPREDVAAAFLMARRPPRRQLQGDDLTLIERLARGPISLSFLMRESRFGALILRRIDALVSERLVMRAGFTPTDALHALGRLDVWDGEAARLAAQVLAAQARKPVERFCEEVVEGVSRLAAAALVSKALSDEAHPPRWDEEPTAALLLERALNGSGPERDLDFSLTMRRPMIAIGAPVDAYMPRVAEQLHTRLLIPPHAGVANAVGAVVGGVVQRHRVLITPLDGSAHLRVHLPDGVHDLSELEEAVGFAREQMQGWMVDLARQAGADQVEVQMDREDKAVPVHSGWGDSIYLGTELIFTAVGRPSPAL